MIIAPETDMMSAAPMSALQLAAPGNEPTPGGAAFAAKFPGLAGTEPEFNAPAETLLQSLFPAPVLSAAQTPDARPIRIDPVLTSVPMMIDGASGYSPDISPAAGWMPAGALTTASEHLPEAQWTQAAAAGEADVPAQIMPSATPELVMSGQHEALETSAQHTDDPSLETSDAPVQPPSSTIAGTTAGEPATPDLDVTGGNPLPAPLLMPAMALADKAAASAPSDIGSASPPVPAPAASPAMASRSAASARPGTEPTLAALGVESSDTTPASILAAGPAASVADAAGPETQGAAPLLAAAAPLAQAPLMQPAVAAPLAAPAAAALMVAVPAEVPALIARAVQNPSGDRITVQLDPPELGRISIDFRFEGTALQHVIVTAETPEALRQLRQMHSELISALEQSGLGEKDMTFQQQTSQDRPQQSFAADTPPRRQAAIMAALDPSLSTAPAPQLSPAGRLDIKL